MRVDYDEDMLQEINANVDLLEYVSNSIELRQKGREYFGSCPLHSDSDPSFTLAPHKNKFYCFSCGLGGQIIEFLYHYENMSYDAAVAKASRLAKVNLSSMCQSQTVKLNKALRKYKTLLDSPRPEPHKFLDRGILSKFRKGAIPEWEQEGILPEVMKLFEMQLDDGGNRIVYPVYDIYENLINIKGRTRFPEFKSLGIPKYINYYSVGVVDYFQGLKVTWPYIKSSNEIIVFEGIKSVMKLYGHGIKNSISAEKHSLTPEQIRWIISSGISNVVFAYDSDVTYKEKKVVQNLNTLKRHVNVFVIQNINNMYGREEDKNSPIDKGVEVWNRLYCLKRKIL